MNGKWFIEKGDHGDVVISTRIRLARNIAKYPFPVRLDTAGRQTVLAEVRKAVQADKDAGFGYIDMSALNRSQAVSLPSATHQPRKPAGSAGLLRAAADRGRKHQYHGL